MGGKFKYIKRILNFYGKGKHKYIYSSKQGAFAGKVRVRVVPKRNLGQFKQWAKGKKRVAKGATMRDVDIEGRKGLRTYAGVSKASVRRVERVMKKRGAKPTSKSGKFTRRYGTAAVREY